MVKIEVCKILNDFLMYLYIKKYFKKRGLETNLKWQIPNLHTKGSVVLEIKPYENVNLLLIENLK